MQNPNKNNPYTLISRAVDVKTRLKELDAPKSKTTEGNARRILHTTTGIVQSCEDVNALNQMVRTRIMQGKPLRGLNHSKSR